MTQLDIFRLLPTSQEQQEGNTGQRFIGEGASVAQPRLKEANAGPVARPSRVNESFASIPSLESLTGQMQGGPGEAGAPPADVIPTGPEGPEGPSAGEQGPLNIALGLVGGLFDILSRLSTAPAYLGQYRDPSSGIVYRPESDHGGRGISDFFPTLTTLEAVAVPGIGTVNEARRYGESLKVWQDTGLNPLQQMMQVFAAPTSNEAMWAQQSPEARGSQRAMEEVLKVPGTVVAAAGEATLGREWQGALGSLKDATLHTATGNIPEALADHTRFARHITLGRTAQDAISQTPGLPDRLGMAIRDAYFEGAADPTKGSTLAAIANSMMDPTWAIMPWGRVGRLADLGASTIAKTPVARTVLSKTGATLKPLGDWAGSTWFALSKTSQAHLAGEGVHDLAARVMQLNGEPLGTGLESGPIIRSLRQVLSEGTQSLPNMKTYLADNPRAKDLLLAEARLKQFNDPKFSVPKFIEENGQLAVPQAKGKGAEKVGLIDRILQKAEQEGWSGTQVADNLKNVVESLTMRQLNPHAPQRGIWSQVYDSIHGINQTMGSFWRPLVLLTRPVYYLNNMSVALMMNTQRYGRWWDRLEASTALARVEGQLPHTTPGWYFPELLPSTDAPLTYSQHFMKSGFSSKGLEEVSGTVIPELLQKIPFLGPALVKGSKGAQQWERFSHELTFANAFHEFLPADIKKFVEASGGSPELIKDLDGVVGVQQALARLGLDQTGYAGVEAWIDYAKMPHNVAEMVKDQVDLLSRGGKLVDGEGVNGAFNQARMELAGMHEKTMDTAMRLKPYSGISQDRANFTRRLSVDATPLQHQLAEEADLIGTEAAKRLDTFHMEDNLVHALAGVRTQGNEAALEQTTRFFKSYNEVLQAVEHRNRAMREAMSKVTFDTNAQLSRMRVGGKTGRVNLEVNQQIAGLWDAYWTTYRNLNKAALNAQESAQNIFTYAMYRKASGQPLSDATVAGYFREATKELRDPKLFNTANVTLGKPAFSAEVKIRPMTAEALAWRKAELEVAKRSSLAGSGGVPIDSMGDLVKELGDTNFNPYLPVDTVAEETSRQLRELQALDNALTGFNDRLNMQQGILQNEVGQLSAKYGLDINQFASDLRAVGAKASDRAVLESKNLNFDYAGGQRNIDTFLQTFFAFHFWPTRYMAWQMQWAAKNPQQASMGLRVLKSWYDGSQDQPWFDKFSIHLANLDYGTPNETQVRFSPANLLFPFGYMAMDVAHSINPDQTSNITDIANVLASGLGGQFYPWVAMSAAVLGVTPDGRPPKTIEDQLKGIVPPVDWIRKGASLVAPGAVGLLTKAEADKVIRSITDDVSLGVVDRGHGVIAATSIAEGKPNDLALEYLKQESPARFAGTLFRAFIGGGSTTTLGERATTEAYQALEKSRTAGEREMVYGAAPGLGIGIAGKTGPSRELGIIYANAPDNPVLRGIYFSAHREKIGPLQQAVAVEQAGKGVPDWKFRAATPEAYERFRAAGGVNLIPHLIDYWYKGQALPSTTEKELQALYQPQGMGALTYRDWKDRILLDSYLQWVAEKRKDLISLGGLTRPQ